MAVIAPGTGWEVFVYSGPADNFSTLLAQVPGWQALSIAPLGSDPGAGSITIPLSSPIFTLGGHTPDNTPVLAYETLWRVTQDGGQVFDFLAETITRTTVQADETQAVTISGPGTAAALNWGMAMPGGWTVPKTAAVTEFTGKLAGIHDPFSTPDPLNQNQFEVDQELWNASTPGAASIVQSGVVTVRASANGGYLGGGAFDATNSSISASVTPVAFGLESPVSAPRPLVLGTATASPVLIGTTLRLNIAGFLAAEQGSGLIMVVQGGSYSVGMSMSDSAGNKWALITSATVSGTAVSMWMSENSKPVTPATAYSLNAGGYFQPLRCTLLRTPPGWQLDAGFSSASGTSVNPALPAQVLRSSPELQVMIAASGGGASGNLVSASSPYSILDSTFGPGNLRLAVCTGTSGSTGVAEGDNFNGVYPSPVPWLVTGFALYWAGGDAGFTSAGSGGTEVGLNGSEVTRLVLAPSARGAPFVMESEQVSGYAMMALSYQEFYCEYQDSNGTITRHVMTPGLIGGATARSPAFNTSWAQYWRISCDVLAGNVVNGKAALGDKLWRFWTSPDGASWTLQWQVRLSRLSFDPSSVNLYLGGSYSGAGAATQFTSLNSEIANPPSSGPLFLSQSVLKSWLQLLQACQARGTLPFVKPAFSQALDSGGKSWLDSWSIQVPAGTDLLTLLQNYAGAIAGDWLMNPGFSLLAGQQGSLGTDRHQTVVFHEGEVTQLGQTQARDQIGNIVVTADGSGVLYAAASQGSMQKWHQRERWLAAGGTIDGASAINVAAAGLLQLDDEVTARVIQIPPNQPGKTVFRDFGIFDWIGVERGDFSGTDSLRVMGITVSVDQDGAETHELVLITYRQAQVQWLQYLVNKLGGQTAAALGGLTASTLSNGLPVVALGSQAFVDPPPLTGSVGGSSGRLGVQSSIAASPEVATGGGIQGSLLTDGSIPQTAIGFTLPGGGTAITYSVTAPVSPNLNDVWYQVSATGVVTGISVWNGTSWISAPIGAGAVSFAATDIGGIQTFVQGTAPTGVISPQSLWFDSAHSMRLNVWSGSAWTPYQFGAGAIATGSLTAAQIAAGSITAQQIAAGTITAEQISAGTITAGELVAGIIVAGIVDATTITAATFIGSEYLGNDFILSPQGEFYYNGTPAANNLISSVSQTQTQDPFGNWYLVGNVSYGPNSYTGIGYIAVQIYEGTINWYKTVGTVMTGGTSPWQTNAIILWNDGGLLFQNPSGSGDVEIQALGTGNVINLSTPVNATGGSTTHPTLITTDTPHAVTFINSWANQAAGNMPLRYRMNPDGTASLKGIIASGTAAAVCNNLPAAYRNPSYNAFHPIVSTVFDPGYIQVGSDGSVVIHATTVTGKAWIIDITWPLS